MNSQRRRRSAGFTLIEVMAVAVLTAIVISAAVTSFLQLTRAQNVATERTRLTRQADALLTRVARDLATAALLVREESVDPLSHPWVFVAERRLPVAGADHDNIVMISHGCPSLCQCPYQLRTTFAG